ncbi:hypothetical protein QTP81_06280 [Alteromonas sp. ASW11-36]|uniref:Phage shock protein B n=1 Tax=Alteromonas arenosi TaxID=3055817 RepID=A0ABT7SVJ4_9ALTE|nr:hypothetical protein [Alteromonas sp. ASW11-36]MDM7860196.1 hypothetical protein [Alteromonas sp. ASW11-36]
MNTTAIAIVAIIAWALVSITTDRKSKRKSKQDTLSSAEKAEMIARMDAMQERIEVLEKIVTDEKYDLNREFENLSKGSDKAA